eukprot:6005361-Prorocentrum_lima.AAC.1
MAIEIDPAVASATQRALGPAACAGTARIPDHHLAHNICELCSRDSEQRGRRCSDTLTLSSPRP